MVYARTVKSLRVFPFLKGLGNYLNFDKKIVKLFPNFTLRHLITLIDIQLFRNRLSNKGTKA